MQEKLNWKKERNVIFCRENSNYFVIEKVVSYYYLSKNGTTYGDFKKLKSAKKVVELICFG